MPTLEEIMTSWRVGGTNSKLKLLSGGTNQTEERAHEEVQYGYRIKNLLWYLALIVIGLVIGVDLHSRRTQQGRER
jgi:hypothetical protein